MTTPDWTPPHQPPAVTVTTYTRFGRCWYTAETHGDGIECEVIDLTESAEVHEWLTDHGLGDFAGHIVSSADQDGICTWNLPQ